MDSSGAGEEERDDECEEWKAWRWSEIVENRVAFRLAANKEQTKNRQRTEKHVARGKGEGAGKR